MKVILTADVKPHGKKGDVVDVSDGYASNFLLPKGLGLPASKSNLHNLENQKKRDADMAAARLEDAKVFKEEVEKKVITIPMKGGEGGRLFGSVTGKEIADTAKSAHGLKIDKKKIVLSEPIKAFGKHEVTLKLHPEVSATLTIDVVKA